MTLQDLLVKKPNSEALEIKKKEAAKHIAADKARAAALLKGALTAMQSPSVSKVTKNVII